MEDKDPQDKSNEENGNDPAVDGPNENGLEAETDQDPENLVRRCRELSGERAELIGRLQRAVADLHNYRKRAARERQELIQQTKVETIEQFLFPVIDDLDRAIQAANDHGYDQSDPLFMGLNMVQQRMFELLKQCGIEPIDALGQPFDPLYHQAVMDQPSSDLPEGTVLKVLSYGYTEAGKTIRPSRVVISKKPEQAGKQ